MIEKILVATVAAVVGAALSLMGVAILDVRQSDLLGMAHHESQYHAPCEPERRAPPKINPTVTWTVDGQEG